MCTLSESQVMGPARLPALESASCGTDLSRAIILFPAQHPGKTRPKILIPCAPHYIKPHIFISTLLFY
jgi:hypothetical protein